MIDLDNQERNTECAKRKLYFFLPSFGHGGAERQVARLLNHLPRSNWQLGLIVVNGGGSYVDNLPPDVDFSVLRTPNLRSSTLTMAAAAYALRRKLALVQPDILFSLLNHANVTAARACRTLPMVRHVAGVQNNLTAEMAASGVLHRLLVGRHLRQALVSSALIITLSQGVCQDVVNHFPALRSKITVIYNAGFDREDIQRSYESIDETGRAFGNPAVVACGRLTYQKDYPTLLRAWAKVVRALPDARLNVLGKGELEAELRTLAIDLGIDDKIIWWGFQDNPFAYFRAADLFVLSSRYEGFGNVVAEAMACGTAVVSTDCDFGPGEIIQDDAQGILTPVEDATSLSRAITKVLEDDELRATMAVAGEQRARAFEASVIAQKYDHALRSMLSETPKTNLEA